MEVIRRDILLKVKLRQIRVSNLCYFISALFVEMKDRPIFISNEGVWRLKVNIYSWSKASWMEGNVIVQGSRKGFISKVEYLGIFYVNGRVDIIGFELRVF